MLWNDIGLWYQVNGINKWSEKVINHEKTTFRNQHSVLLLKWFRFNQMLLSVSAWDGGGGGGMICFHLLEALPSTPPCQNPPNDKKHTPPSLSWANSLVFSTKILFLCFSFLSYLNNLTICQGKQIQLVKKKKKKKERRLTNWLICRGTISDWLSTFYQIFNVQTLINLNPLSKIYAKFN